MKVLRMNSQVALLAAVALAFGSGCASSRGRDLVVRTLELEGAADALVVPTEFPLRDLQWNGHEVIGIAGRELVALRLAPNGDVAPQRLWKLPPEVQPRPVLAVEGERVWLVDAARSRLYRVQLGEPLKIESFVLPGELAGARFVDLEWDSGRRLLWGVERVGHRVVALSVDEERGIAQVDRRLGGLGRGGASFNVPLDVALDDSGRLWVLDSLNRRLVQLDPETHTVLRVLGGDDPAHRTMLPRPRAMCVDASGDPWVYDDARGELVHFDLRQPADETPLQAGGIALPASASRMVRAGDRILVGQPLSTRVLELTPRR